MSELDLQKIIGGNSIKNELKDRIKTSLIINIYTVNNECIKIGAGSDDNLSISSIVNIEDDFLTIRFESHDVNILYNSIVKIEYFNKGVIV
jgi:hypothetical protein